MCGCRWRRETDRVAIDGSKIKANASKHRGISHERMRCEERRLREEVKRLLAEAEQVDKAAMNCWPSWPAVGKAPDARQSPIWW